MSSSSYISIPIDTNADDLSAESFAYLRSQIPGFTPSEGNLEVAIIEIVARLEAETRDVAATVPDEIFRFYGKSILGFPSIDAASAQVQTTWTATDSSGYVIPSGTLVVYQAASSSQTYFTVQNDVVIGVGSTSTATGEVVLVASATGTAANGVPAGTVLQIVDALPYVTSIVTTTISSGGVEAETDAAYLSRLHDDLQLLTPTPILPDDFAVLARNIAGVDRAVAIDGYNPADGTFNNERMVTVALADLNGNAVPSGVAAQVQAYLAGKREVNFIVNTLDPIYTTVNVTATVKTKPGYDLNTVQAAATQAVLDYLNPANWDWAAVVRRFELVSLLDQIDGVDYVDSVSVPGSDIHLDGVASLARAGAVAISVL